MSAPLTSRERRLLHAYRNRVIQTARAFLHTGSPGNALAEYSNGTVLRIVDAIVKLPWTEPKKGKTR